MKKYIIPAAILPAMALACACSHSDNTERPEAETVDVALPAVDSVVLYHEYPGYLSADDEVDLVARVDGYLTAKPYDAGAYVKKGTVLYTIEDKKYRDAVQQARSQLATARANYEYAKTRYNALSAALVTDAVSRMEVNQAKSDLDQAEASISNAEAALQSAQTTLSYCVVRAPFDGHVTKSTYSVGAYLAGAGQPVVLGRILADKIMTVNFAIDDNRYISLVDDIRNGQNIDFRHIPLKFSSPLTHEYTADLDYMAPLLNKQTGTMIVQAQVDNTEGELKSGMYATISLPYGSNPKALLIRDASIGTDQLGKYVYVVNDSNRVVYTPIEVGQTVGDTMRIVTKGLTPGSRYVTKAMLKVRDGMEVNPRQVK